MQTLVNNQDRRVPLVPNWTRPAVPKRHSTMTGNVSGKEIEAAEVPFRVVREDWNEYALDGGIRVRVKASVAKIGRQIDAVGNFAVNDYGEPAVLVRYVLEVVTGKDSDDDTD